MHIVLSSLHTDCATDKTARVSNPGRSRQFSPSIVKRSEGFSNRVFIINGRYIDQMKFAVYMDVSLISFFLYSSGSILYYCIHGCMFCMLLSNFVNYVLLCYVFLSLC
jgi:hypothetical protein